MPRDGAIIRDIVGKLAVLNVECDKCGRRGRYHVHRLVEHDGIDAKPFDWSDEIMADYPRKQARNLNDQCGAVPGSAICRWQHIGHSACDWAGSLISGPIFAASVPVVTNALCDRQGR